MAPDTSIDHARLFAAYSSSKAEAHDAAVERWIVVLKSQVWQLTSDFSRRLYEGTPMVTQVEASNRPSVDLGDERRAFDAQSSSVKCRYSIFL